MTTIFSGLHVALQTMLASQQAVQTVEHNVANANTPGYHRQEVKMSAGRAYTMPGLYTSSTGAGQIGTGVEVHSVARFRAAVFDGSYRQELAQSAYWKDHANLLGQVETRMMEVGESGMLTKLDAFWAGWRNLESDPTNMTLRSDLLERAGAVASGFKDRVTALKSMQTELNGSVVTMVGDINTTAARVAELNAQIGQVQAAGQQPNDLMDQRDLLIEHLSQAAGATASVQANGQALVSIGGHALVVGSKTFELQTTTAAGDPPLAQVEWAHDPTLSFNLPKSQLSAVLDVRNEQIPDQIDGLNDLAGTLIGWVNTRHAEGYGLNGSHGVDFFQGTDASSIGLSAAMSDRENIAAAMVDQAAGDGGNAGRLANFQFEGLLAGSTDTLNSRYHDQVTQLGLKIGSSGSKSNAHSLLVDSLNQQRHSVAGVSLDEEAANLVRYQATYQAAARLATAVDEMIDRVINGMGRVGL